MLPTNQSMDPVRGHARNAQRNRIHAREVCPFRPSREPCMKQCAPHKHQDTGPAHQNGPFGMAAQISFAPLLPVGNAMKKNPKCAPQIGQVGISVDFVAKKRAPVRFLAEIVEGIGFSEIPIPEMPPTFDQQIEEGHEGTNGKGNNKCTPKGIGKDVFQGCFTPPKPRCRQNRRRYLCGPIQANRTLKWSHPSRVRLDNAIPRRKAWRSHRN
jgi:hypothetical protein